MTPKATKFVKVYGFTVPFFQSSSVDWQRAGHIDWPTATSEEWKYMSKFYAFVRDESGATAIEYGLIAALISVVIIAVLTTTGNTLKAKFQEIADALAMK
jgi:pilus assembly protein Flp/PilA